MTHDGRYEEPLFTGGKLVVTKTSWWLEYYFPGPDLRYSGEFLRINEHEVNAYIQAFQENWHTYETLKKSIPSGGEFTQQGKMEMSIRIGSADSGIYLRPYHMLVRDKHELDRVISDYQNAVTRARQVQGLLFQL